MSKLKFEDLPKDLQDALRRCDVLVGDDQIEYYYQLYDPKTGGFYYSISSRDAEKMTPFAEGTAFAQEALLNGGMVLPEWYKEKVGSWILGHQDESDGFFYEELWGKITSGPRLNRDLGSSAGILENCDKKPLYTLPQERMQANESEKETNATLPERLRSKEKMLEFMESLDWSQKSIWSTGQKLSSETTLIKAAGLYDFVADYVQTRQNPETGLFGEGLDWMNTNGAMKLGAFMASRKGGYARAEKAIDSVLKLYGGDTPPTSATWIWNPFVLLERIVNAPDADGDRLLSLLYEKGADIINKAIDCALILKREDGGFSASITRAANRQQGYLFGYGLSTESDLDGTLIAGPRLRNTIYKLFGLVPDKTHYKKFNDEFWERIKNKPPVEKTIPRPEGPLNPYWSQDVRIFEPVW